MAILLPGRIILTNLSWHFDNSYARLPENFYSRMAPVAVSAPKVVAVNHTLAGELGLSLRGIPGETLAQVFSGNTLPGGAEPIAQAYAGHQFGHFTMLGDGRAHLIGEIITPGGKRVDIQFKGSGRTAYGRRGDGRAALGPMLREYIISEAMYALGIATTRSLAVVSTGEPVYRETVLKGAVLTRVAASHLRVGTFEYLAASQDKAGLKQLVEYAIDRHYPEAKEADNPSLALLKAVLDRQVALVVDWLRTGFIHGVMNTDNMAISGETIDYGPCAFMDEYDPHTVFSSIDHAGRYAYANQPRIAQWNLARFAETLLSLLHEDIEQAVTLAAETVETFITSFRQQWLAMMRRKLGLLGEEEEDEQLITNLLQWMQQEQADYTNSFRELITEGIPQGEQYQADDFKNWWQQWQQRIIRNTRNIEDSFTVMRANNPVIIPRNHRVQEALAAAEENEDLTVMHKLIEALAEPYKDKKEHTAYKQPPEPEERVHQTFCGT